MTVATTLSEVVDGQLTPFLSIFLSIFCGFFGSFTTGVVIQLRSDGDSIRDALTPRQLLVSLVTATIVTFVVFLLLPLQHAPIRDAAVENVEENMEIGEVLHSSVDRGDDIVLTLEYQQDDTPYTERLTFTYNDEHGIMVPNATPEQRDSLHIRDNSDLDTLLERNEVVLESR